MSLPVRSVTPEFYVAAQLAPADMAAAAAMGFKTVICNRPDMEGGAEQPASSSMQAAAEAAGLHYVYLPVVAGSITPERQKASTGCWAASNACFMATACSGVMEPATTGKYT